MNLTYKRIIGEYDIIDDFSEGLAFVRKNNGKSGYINANGDIVVPIIYDHQSNGSFVFTRFNEGYSAVFFNNKLGFIDKTGNIVIDCGEYDYAYEFQEGLVGVRKGKKYGFINNNGETIVPLIYSWVYGFNEGLAIAKMNGKYGYINKNNENVIPFIFDKRDGDIGGFREGLALVEINNNKSYINKTGAEIIAFKDKYKQVIYLRDGFSCVTKGETLNINEISTDYSKNPHAALLKNQSCGLIDISNKIIIPLEYDMIYSLIDDIFVAVKNGKQYYYDNTGDLLNITDYDLISFGYKDGLALIKDNDEYCYVNSTGKIELRLHENIDFAGLFSEGIAPIKKGDLYGFIDKTGKSIIPPEFDYIKQFHSGISIVRKNDEWGLLKITN